MDHLMPYPELAVTHAGIFHADDVCACAFLQLINSSIAVIRTNDVEAAKLKDPRLFASLNYVVFDIGGGEFDHHTPETVEKRPPRPMRDPHDEPYSSFGKIVRAYHDYLMSEDEYRRFDRRICVPIDYTDCVGKLWGGAPNMLSDFISSMNGSWYEDNSSGVQFSRFMAAVALARDYIERTIDHIKHDTEADELVEAANRKTLDQGIRHFIELDKYAEFVPTFRRFKNASFAWAMYPSLRGGWQIYSARIFGENRDALTDRDIDWMKKTFGDKVTFVHPGKFTASFSTRAVAREVMMHLENTWNDRPHPDDDTRVICQ